jgi:hypothetical protein
VRARRRGAAGVMARRERLAATRVDRRAPLVEELASSP